MAGRHCGRRPECDDEAEIDGMPQVLVERRGLECVLGYRLPGKIGDHLLHPKQFEILPFVIPRAILNTTKKRYSCHA